MTYHTLYLWQRESSTDYNFQDNRAALPCKARRQYPLTLEVNRHRPLAPHNITGKD